MAPLRLKDTHTSEAYINFQTELINDNIEFRKEWEEDCKKVALSYGGNKFPSTMISRATGTGDGKVKRAKDKPVYLNLIKRQYRVMGNFLRNNEPQYLISEASEEAEEKDLIMIRESLDSVFAGAADENDGFYDTIMDDTIHYGFHRAICWTLAYWTQEGGYRFKSYDPMDTFIDLDARRTSDVKKFLITYTMDREDLKEKYPQDGNGKPIKWEDVEQNLETTESDIKKCLLTEKPDSNTLIVREGLYLQGKELYRVITTKDQFLQKELIAGLDFMPVTAFNPGGDPDKLYPRGWFVDMLALEKEINELLAKLFTISKTGGRYVYVRSGTVLTKATNNLMNSIGIEVIEVAESQELPQQANLLQISQADIQLLDFAMRQADEEGGMKQDIMGTSSTGANASGRAIQALQAGSKNNVGMALGELNKYMTRLTRIVLRMFAVYGTEGLYSEESKSNVQLKENAHKLVKVKVTVTGRDAFDEVTKQMNAIEILNMIQKFNPNTPLPPSMITKIMGVTNDIANDVQEEIDRQTNPDIQIAEGENKKLMTGTPMNVNETDDHMTHLGLHSALLKSLPPESEGAQALMDHMRQHDAFGAIPGNGMMPGKMPGQS